MSEAISSSPASFILKDFALQRGVLLSEANVVYQTYGALNAERSNVVLYPTSYGAQHMDVDWLIRPDGILDPTKKRASLLVQNQNSESKLNIKIQN